MTLENYEDYKEIEVDNSKCSRRFHIHFDPTAEALEETTIKCPHCEATVLTKKNHQKLYLAREENLVNTPERSSKTMKDCFLINK